MPDPATHWCAGRARHTDLSSCCPRRTNCAHWRALIEWGIEHKGLKPVPAEVLVCQAAQRELIDCIQRHNRELPP